MPMPACFANIRDYFPSHLHPYFDSEHPRSVDELMEEREGILDRTIAKKDSLQLMLRNEQDKLLLRKECCPETISKSTIEIARLKTQLKELMPLVRIELAVIGLAIHFAEEQTKENSHALDVFKSDIQFILAKYQDYRKQVKKGLSTSFILPTNIQEYEGKLVSFLKDLDHTKLNTDGPSASSLSPRKGVGDAGQPSQVVAVEVIYSELPRDELEDSFKSHDLPKTIEQRLKQEFDQIVKANHFMEMLGALLADAAPAPVSVSVPASDHSPSSEVARASSEELGSAHKDSFFSRGFNKLFGSKNVKQGEPTARSSTDSSASSSSLSSSVREVEKLGDVMRQFGSEVKKSVASNALPPDSNEVMGDLALLVRPPLTPATTLDDPDASGFPLSVLPARKSVTPDLSESSSEDDPPPPPAEQPPPLPVSKLPKKPVASSSMQILRASSQPESEALPIIPRRPTAPPPARRPGRMSAPVAPTRTPFGGVSIFPGNKYPPLDQDMSREQERRNEGISRELEQRNGVKAEVL